MLIAHLSDLHFGTEESDVVHALRRKLVDIEPDLTIISGDFTQIGNDEEFQKAKAFLDAIPGAHLCVPGNHDVPAVELFERFLKPYDKYKKYIDRDLCPEVETKDAVVAGLNSARRALPHWNWANGAVSQKQRDSLKTVFLKDDPRWKICVLHHPVHKVHDMPIDVTVFGRKRTLDCLHDLGVDLVLTGHVHHASIITRGDESHQTVYLSASTALSSRIRGQENGFNLIDLDGDRLTIKIMKLLDGEFVKTQEYVHTRL